MSKRGGKTSPIGSPDQDAPAAPPPSAGNPVEGIQPDESIDPAVNQGGRTTDDLLAETKRMLEDVTEQLREEIEAHSRTKSMAKKREAEFKIFEQAQTGHEQRAKDLLASLDSSERKSGCRSMRLRFNHSSDRLVLEFEVSCRLKKRYSSESALVGSINVHLVVFVPQVLQ